jgi:hypothetical protein
MDRRSGFEVESSGQAAGDLDPGLADIPMPSAATAAMVLVVRLIVLNSIFPI